MEEVFEEKVLRPFYHTSRNFYLATLFLLAVIGLAGYAWLTQLTQGLSVTGMRTLGAGAPWGVYIITFIWYVGIAHGGIAVSAAIRIMKLKQYKPIARIAELITIITLMMAGLCIIFDIGRPDRAFNMLLYYGERIKTSLLTWDLTVVFTYLVLSITYLVITMRGDLAAIYDRVPKPYRLIYKILLIGYENREREKVEQVSWWLAVCLIVLMALLSGGVVAWLFGLMVSQPGWFSAVQGPYFLTAALASAIAAVIVVAAIIRRTLGWHEEINLDIFKGLSKMLAVLILIYLWFILHEQLTIQYAGPIPEREISNAMLFGRIAPIFWTVIGGLIATHIYLAAQAIRPSLFSLKRTVITSIVVLALFWLKRYLIVVPTLLYTRLPFTEGSYTPTWVEWSIVAGTLAISALMYMIFTKIFPLMELEHGEET